MKGKKHVGSTTGLSRQRTGRARWETASVAALLAFAACDTLGRVHVSQPEVHTRERLVAERARESSWIAKQLDRTDEAATGLHGLHDLRTFTGLFAEARASFDPGKGELNQSHQDALESLAKARALDAKITELAAQQRYEAALEAHASGKPVVEPGEADPPGSITTEPLPSNDAPFGKSFKDLPAVPSPKDPVKTEAQRSALDAFHDKLAYRDAVNNALRESQLDDAHDVFGHTLYELGFDVTLVPGARSRQFVQVNVEIVPDVPKEPDATGMSAEDRERLDKERKAALAKREIQLGRLFDGWLRDLDDQMVVDYAELRSRVRSEWPPTKDSDTVLWLMREAIPVVQGRLAKAKTFLGEKVLQQQSALDESVLAASKVIAEVERHVAGAAATPEQGEPDLLGRLDAVLAHVVWCAYAWELHKVVQIGPPVGGSIAGCLVEEAPQATPSSPPAGSEATAEHQNYTGRARFVRSLLEAEQRMTAIDVQPKEHVQTISDVSARESVLNVLFALRALLGTSGVDAQGQMQYLSREQEIVHALLRKPLLIGFGRGGSQFGWVAGPRLAINGASVDFVHGPVRHDFSASISVPAWLTQLRLRGQYHWIEGDGDLGKGTPIWPDKELIVRLPMPENRNRAITAALVGHHASALARVYRDSARPRPRIERPAHDSAAGNLLVAGEKNQRLLVMGEHLWREPQVFVGNQRADHVDVLADMNGLLAYFDDLQFPGDPPERGRDGRIQDLHVVTSYGRARVPQAVTILPPRPKAADNQKPAAMLLTTFVSPDQRALRFAFARPKAYAGLRVALRASGEAAWTHHTAVEQWNDKEDVVAIELPAWSGSPAVFEVVLEQQTRAGADWTAVGKETQRFARFKAEADRAAVLRAGATVDFDAAGKPKPGTDTIRVTTASDVEAAFAVAYPGFREAVGAATVRLTLTSPARQEAVALVVRAATNAQGCMFLVEPAELAAKVVAIAGTGPPTREWTPALTFGRGDKAVTIPIVADSGNPPVAARITAKRDAVVIGVGAALRGLPQLAASSAEKWWAMQESKAQRTARKPAPLLGESRGAGALTVPVTVAARPRSSRSSACCCAG